MNLEKISMDCLQTYQRKITGYQYEEYSSNPKFRNGDTLLAKITPCLENGKTAQVDILDNNEIAFGSSEFIVLRANETSDKDFIYYLARSPAFREKAISCMEGTSGRKRVNQKSLENQVLPCPDIITQKKIAAVLSSLDDKIELNNRINSELENLAKTIYDYWFVQFDFPDENGKPYKSSGGKMVYNQELKREIPAGWEVKPLVEWICNDKGGDWGQDVKEGNFNTKVICIRGTDLNGLNGNGEFKAPIRYIIEKNSHKFLEPFDLIVEISGGSSSQSTGRLGYISSETLRRFNTPVICSNFCKAISLNNVKSLYYFVYLWNSIYNNKVFFNWEGKTTGIKNLLFDSFVNSYITVFPPISLIEKFFNIRQTIESQQQINILQNQQLTQLRDWLLPMLMNGQITVK
ncbi:MAG: restriction endonuclease subunit S [Dolichospermum sp.]